MKILVSITLFIITTNSLLADVMVYTSRKEHLVKNIFKDFEKDTGIKINYRTGKAGALIQTIKTEGENSPADVFMTVDAGNLWYASNEGILDSVKSSTLMSNIPGYLRDKNNEWFGLSVRARTIVYNTKKVKTQELTTYEDLGNKKWKNKLCLRTSKKVYNQSLVAMFIDQHGYSKAKDIVKSWVDNATEIFSNDTSVLKAIASGQCDVGIVNTYYYGSLMKKNSSLPLKLFWPNQTGSYGVHVNVSGAGLVKTSKNKKEALRLLEWLSSKKAQGKFASVNFEYPANPQITPDPTVKAWGDFKSSQFQLTKAGMLQKKAVKLMNEANYK